jgi:hypothetical protein
MTSDANDFFEQTAGPPAPQQEVADTLKRLYGNAWMHQYVLFHVSPF